MYLFLFSVVSLQEKIALVGTGGAGNTYMCGLLKKQNVTFNQCNNADGIKHALSPLSGVIHASGATKAIFVYSDLIRSIYSHYRRQWAKDHFKNFAADSIPDTFGEFVNTFDSKGYDISGVERQLLSWRFLSPFPVLFIDFSQPIGNSLSRFVGRDIVFPKIDKQRLERYDDVINSRISESFKLFYRQIYESFINCHGKIYNLNYSC